MTTPLRIDGFDISHYQEYVVIDWAKAKAAGVKFMYHKATQGDSIIDDNYEKRRAEAKKNGILFGAYHFATPRKGSAVAEAKHFLEVAKPQPGDLLPALDLEENPANLSEVEMSHWVHEFISTVRQALGLKRAVLYTRIPLTGKFAVHLWVPRYSNSNTSPWFSTPFTNYAIWQFSNGEFGVPNRVPGVPVPVDIDHLSPLARVRFAARFTIPKK